MSRKKRARGADKLSERSRKILLHAVDASIAQGWTHCANDFGLCSYTKVKIVRKRFRFYQRLLEQWVQGLEMRIAQLAVQS